MNKFVIFAIIAIPALAVSFLMTDPFVVAKQQSKIQFTKTFTSSNNPGIGEQGQFALILAPNKDSLYTGTMTFTANQPVEVLVLHDLTKQDSKGQPTWSVDGNTVYGLTVIEPKSAGTFDFTGAALAFRSKTPFVVTTSLDGWIRGQPIEVTSQTFEVKPRDISLADQNILVTIPMHDGFFGKGAVSYIMTDASNQTLADKISHKQGSDVKFAPKLRWMPSQDTIYAFTNGVKGDGIYGFQGEVFSSSPDQKDSYTPIRSLATISWKAGQVPQILQSADDILKAEKDSRIRITKTNVTINAPQIVWPAGQIPITNSTDSLDNTQVTSIDKNSKKVTFVAHRAWSADGRTTYYIIPDATPKGPADIMKVPVSAGLAKAASSSILTDMYQFKNGIKGAGPLGFQPSILSTIPDESYVPICRVSIVEWKNENSAVLLQTISDIESKKADGSIFVTLARPLSEDHIVNCPIVELPAKKG